MTKRTVLITGAGGFTGQYVIDAFRQAGYAVVAWTHVSDPNSTGRGVDLCDADRLATAMTSVDPDVVVHLAAISQVGHADLDELYRVNIVGTRNLLKVLTDKPRRPARVILAGTANIYGNVDGVIGEDSQPRPQNDYAVSKLAMEYMAKLWSDALNITVVRPFNYTGVGQSGKFLIPKIVTSFRSRLPSLELGNIDVVRDFNDVRNVARIYVDLAHGGDHWEVLNVCTGQEYSIRDILRLLHEITDFMPQVSINPQYVRANDVIRLVGNPTRLLERVGRLPDFNMKNTLSWMLGT